MAGKDSTETALAASKSRSLQTIVLIHAAGKLGPAPGSRAKRYKAGGEWSAAVREDV